jgi:MerR family redox-sensitive transcriptional activator SoxR
MSGLSKLLTIGEIAHRSGVPHSALRFYEERGLIASERTSGNQRRYQRATLRRLAFIRAAQRVGLSLQQISDALATLPAGRQAPSATDWARLSETWRAELDIRIDGLERLRDRLSGCIGCGCLSLDRCWMYNPNDELARFGDGGVKLRPALEGGL